MLRREKVGLRPNLNQNMVKNRNLNLKSAYFNTK